MPEPISTKRNQLCNDPAPMIHAADVLRHRFEAGWVVLASRVPQLGGATPELANHLVQSMDLSRPPVCLVLQAGEIDGLATWIEELEGLLGLAPVPLDAALEPPLDLKRSSMILMAGGTPAAWVERLSASLLEDVLSQALKSHAIVMPVGAAAAAMGKWMRAGEGPALPGLNWVNEALILPDTVELELDGDVRQTLRADPDAYALGLGHHSIVALGPDGEIEIWGEPKPTILLGQGWQGQA